MSDQSDGATGRAGPAARRLASEAEALALASPLRLRILRLTHDEALTNRELADRLEKNPASVLHHVRRLVDTGFLAPQEARRGRRGAREIPYLSTRLSWRLESAADMPPPLLETFLGDIEGLAPDQVEQTRLGVRMAPERWDAFRDRLYALLEEMAQEPSDPGAEAFSIFLAVHADARGRSPHATSPPSPGDAGSDTGSA